MNDHINSILNGYDIRRVNKQCNVKECSNMPSKEIAIYELDIYTGKSRAIISIYLCEQHSQSEYEKLKDYAKSLKVHGKKIILRVFNVD